MRTLFTKVMLWFLGVMAFTVFAFLLTTAMNMNATRPREHLFGNMLALHAEEAEQAFHSGGAAGLSAYLDRFQSTLGPRAMLVDAHGRDVLTGADRSELLAEPRRPGRAFSARPAAIARQTADQRYWFVVLVQRQRSAFSFFVPDYLWIVAVVVLLSYFLALRLTSPLRRIRWVVERFGHGDFSARVNSHRRDELGELARTFDQMADRLQTLLAAERRLLLDISHELRSPLARLAVAVELARSGDDRDREAALNRIEKEADRLNSLVTGLLQVTRAEGDPGALRTEPVRLDELLAGVVDDSQLEAEARGCRVELKANPPATAIGDSELLHRALENVVRNAVRHTATGTAVEVRLEKNGQARISVRDYGPGVPEEHLQRIFDAFYRVETDRNRSSGGAGLGLAIARRAIVLHKGRIAAHNANPGLQVDIDLPISEPQSKPGRERQGVSADV